MEELLYRDEVFAIQGAIFDVSREMGVGFLENVYEECLILEFLRRNIPYVKKPVLTLSYRGTQLEQTYVPDLVCYGKIIIELKAVREIAGVHRAQVINYLKATGLQLGLLANFGCYPKATIERVVFSRGAGGSAERS